MKIRIEFNDNEKKAIADTIELPLDNDVKTLEEGAFGTSIYDPYEKYIEMEVKEDFIIDLADIVSDVVRLVKRFLKKWVKDVTCKAFDKDGDEVVRTYTEDGSFEYVKASEVE